MAGKSPAFQFYPSDWIGCTELMACSLEARGLWFAMICLMHSGNPYGFLTLPNGREIDEKMIKKMLNLSQKDSKKLPKLVQELDDNGVFLRSKEGVIYSKRMVRDEAKRKDWRERQAKKRKRDVTPMSPEDVTDVSPGSSILHSSIDLKPNGLSQPPVVASTEPQKEKNVIWGDGLALLVNSGTREYSARAFLGRAKKEYGESALEKAITATLIEDPPEPKAFLMGCLKNSKTSQPKQAQVGGTHNRLHGRDIVPSDQREGGRWI